MFERFTDQGRQVIVLAQDEARELKHNYIGVEHLLLGLLREETSPGRELLDSTGATAGDVRARLRSSVGEGAEPSSSGHFPFTPRVKKTFELALREALARGDDYIGPEHILLGLMSVAGVPNGPLVTDGHRVKEGVVRILSGPPDQLSYRDLPRRGL